MEFSGDKMMSSRPWNCSSTNFWLWSTWFCNYWASISKKRIWWRIYLKIWACPALWEASEQKRYEVKSINSETYLYYRQNICCSLWSRHSRLTGIGDALSWSGWILRPEGLRHRQQPHGWAWLVRSFSPEEMRSLSGSLSSDLYLFLISSLKDSRFTYTIR